jgi:hypothetical protein
MPVIAVRSTTPFLPMARPVPTAPAAVAVVTGLTADRLSAATAAGTVPASALSLAPRPASWKSPEVQQAYAAWLPERWAQWKANREEGDCKTTATKLMVDFRTHYKETTGFELPDPFKGKAKWVVGTQQKPNGIHATVPLKGPVRPEYRHARGQSVIDGPNHRIPGISADAVAKYYSVNVPTRNGEALVTKSTGDGGYPKGDWRINQDLLQPGDVIVQQHRRPNDTKWDHAITVLQVEKDELGRTKRLTMAIGSFDDLKDDDAATPATNQVNFYSYEQTIDFADGQVTDATITWQSDAALRPIGAKDTLKERLKRAHVILGAEQRLTEVHSWQ